MNIDTTDRPEELLRLVDPVDERRLAMHIDQGTADTLLVHLMASARPSWRGRSRRALVAAVALLVVMATSAAGYGAWLALRPEQNTGVGCQLEADAFSDTWITGDPVLDCQRVWRQEYGDPVPRLAAYVTDEGGIMVRPAAWAVPAGWRLLPEGFRLDAALLDLERTLGDHIRGLPETCLDAGAARVRVLAELTRTGLNGWRISQRDEPDGRESCAVYYFVRPDRREVTLGSEKPATDKLPYREMAARLRTAPDCLDREAALAATRAAGADAGLVEGVQGYQVLEIPDAIAGSGYCARITMQVAGSITIQLSVPPS